MLRESGLVGTIGVHDIDLSVLTIIFTKQIRMLYADHQVTTLDIRHDGHFLLVEFRLFHQSP